MKKVYPQVVIHILGCLFFLSLPVFLSPDFGSKNLFDIVPFQRNWTEYALLVLLFYGNRYLLIPKLWFRKRHLIYSALLAAIFLFIAFVPSFFFPFMSPNHSTEMTTLVPRPRAPESSLITIFGKIFIQFCLVVIFSFFLAISNQLRTIQKEKVQAQLDLLKDQINPHFLFNSLNSIYSLALEKSDLTPKAVMLLAEMMRYVLTDASSTSVLLEKEIGYINDYIELQKLRLAYPETIHFSVQIGSEQQEIAPLLLIPFIENAFKYGSFNDPEKHIEISLTESENTLTLTVVNHINEVLQETAEKTGLGIRNTQERLLHLYPLHVLSIESENGIFAVLLKIPLQ